MTRTPFDTLDSAHDYLRLLAEQVVAVNVEIGDDLRHVHDGAAGRTGDALRLVSYKLHQLEAHVTAARALLNDLKMLRRVLVRDQDDAPAVQSMRG
jgi:hypothetical protein